MSPTPPGSVSSWIAYFSSVFTISAKKSPIRARHWLSVAFAGILLSYLRAQGAFGAARGVPRSTHSWE